MVDGVLWAGRRPSLLYPTRECLLMCREARFEALQAHPCMGRPEGKRGRCSGSPMGIGLPDYHRTERKWPCISCWRELRTSGFGTWSAEPRSMTFDGSTYVPFGQPTGNRSHSSRVVRGDYGVYWEEADGTGKNEPIGLSGRHYNCSCLLVRRWEDPCPGQSIRSHRSAKFYIVALSLEGDAQMETAAKGKV